MRELSEKLGATVSYNADRKTVKVKSGVGQFHLNIGKRKAMVGGISGLLDMPVIDRNGVVMAPLRLIAEVVSGTVSWDKRGNYHIISIFERDVDIQNYSDYTPTRLFQDFLVSLNATITSKPAQDKCGGLRFEAITENGIKLYVYAPHDMSNSLVKGNSIRMTGKLENGKFVIYASPVLT